MANLQFNVDTSPMAQSVDSSRKHIGGVAVAVTAMEAAVIAAELKSSKTICENVDNGFYMLIKSQISQKAVAAYTEMTSRQISLMQLAKALENTKRQMENDFNMITRRYAKLFNSLNRALELRIKELDRPAMQLADIKRIMVFDKLKDDSSLIFSISSEVFALAQTALSAKLKQKTREAMETLTESVNENSSYSEKVETILVKNESDNSGDSGFRYLPAVFFETESLLSSNDSIESIHIAQSDVWQNTNPFITEINNTHDSMPWKELDTEEKNAIRREFLALCEKEEDERLTNEITRLFDESSWEVLRK